MTRINAADAIAALDHNLTELLGIQSPAEEPVADAAIDSTRRRRRLGLFIALPISLALAAITAGVFGPEGWLPAVPVSKPAVETADNLPLHDAAKTPAEIAVREPLPEAGSMPTSEEPAVRHHSPHHSFEARPTRFAGAEPVRSRPRKADGETANNSSQDDPDGRLAAIDSIRMLRLR